MLASLKTIKNCIVVASDGEIGKVKEFLFDDQTWKIRYLVVRAGHWISKEKVLISPVAVTDVDVDAFRIHLSLTQDQVKNSPDVDTDSPVSRQFETTYHDYYHWPYYWNSLNEHNGAQTGVLNLKAFQAEMLEQPYPLPYSPAQSNPPQGWMDGDPHLRSSQAVRGYKVSVEDKHFGAIEDLVIDLETWDVRYFVIDTISFWPGNSVILAPQWIDSIDRDLKQFRVKLTRKQIKSSPKYYTDETIDREYEEMLYNYYGHSKYWNQDARFHCIGSD